MTDYSKINHCDSKQTNSVCLSSDMSDTVILDDIISKSEGKRENQAIDSLSSDGREAKTVDVNQEAKDGIQGKDGSQENYRMGPLISPLLIQFMRLLFSMALPAFPPRPGVPGGATTAWLERHRSV